MSDIGDVTGGGDVESSTNALLGGANQQLATAKVGLQADTTSVSKLKSAFSSLRAELKKVREEMEGVARASKDISGPGGRRRIGQTNMAGAPFDAAMPGTQTGRGDNNIIPPSDGRFARVGAAASAAGAAVATAIQTIDARAERGRAYALSADRMSLVYQQMYGLSQGQVMGQYRTPMAKLLLGEGGVNALMSMQATTGINALQQARSVEAMRIMSGFSISAGQATNMISQLATPEVANRMFMLGGTGLIGPGGQQRSTTQVMQDIVRSAGLTDPRLAKSALAPGSITRSNLTMMGVTGEMQDMVIQYAMQNVEFRKRGGRGMYDPTNKEDQKTMGIKDNFAMEAERTDQTRIAREEQFYRRQADNFADLERQTQTLTKAMAKLEDSLSGIIGAGISTKGARGIIGSGLKIAGAASMFIPGGVGVGLGLMAAGTMLGDAVEGDKTIPYGYGNSKVKISDLSSKSTFSKLHPTFKERLQKMFAANPAVGIGGGFRDSAQQEKMFRERYTPTNEKTDVFWNGQYWKHTSGAPAAPPGRSMHEIGLAADLVGDLDWVQKNASRFGLKVFGHLGEPWHVQPADLPGSRREYEEQGAPWGTMGQPASKDTTSPVKEHSGASPDTGAPMSVGGALAGYAGQLSISEKIAAVKGSLLGASAPGQVAPGKERSSRKGTSTNTTPGLGGGSSGETVARLLYAAGFRGKDLAEALAISWRESRWNPRAHNPSYLEGGPDNSYGLMQINMHPTKTSDEANREAWGIPNNEALFDPATNVRIAFEKYKWNKAHERHPFQDWMLNGSHLTGTSEIMAEATRIASDVEKGGDPVASSGPATSRSVQSTSISGNHTFNISPNITINGSASQNDLRQMAKEVARLIEQEVRTKTLRSL